MESRNRTTDWKAIRWIYGIIGGKIWNVRVLTFLRACESGVSLAYAWLFRSIIDAAGAKDLMGVRNATIWFLICLAVQLTVRALVRYLEEDGRADIENALKLHLFDQVLSRDYQQVSALHSADWMNRLTSDTRVVADNFIQIMPGFVNMVVSIVGALAILIVILPGSMAVIIPAGIALVILSFLFREKLKSLHRAIQESDGRLRTFLQERLNALMIVRVFNGQNQEHAQAESYMADHKAQRMRRNHFANFSNVGFGLLMNGAYIFGGIYCAFGIYKGTITFGTMAAVLQLTSMIKSPFANISGYLPMLYAMIASAERLMEADQFDGEKAARVYTEEEMRDMYRDKLESIELKDVSFGYGNRRAAGDAASDSEDQERSDDADGSISTQPVIENCSMKINKGETIGITGQSGCGKSTLLKLLMGMYPMTSGNIVANTTSDSIDMDAGWRSLFSYVPQGNILMQDTIAGIVSYGHDNNTNAGSNAEDDSSADAGSNAEDDSSADAGSNSECGRAGMNDYEKHIWRALKIADAEDFVRALPDGINTQLGESGAGLSEGQMQRLAIARAVYSGRPVLMLDEATSSLDAASEAHVLQNLRAMEDTTVIIVTHRSTALEITDRVLKYQDRRFI